MAFELRVKTHFDAAHHLEGYQGKCANQHGHRWDVEVVLGSFELNSLNMVTDFGDVKKPLNRIIDEKLDHHDINVSLGEKCPTAEFLAKWLYTALSQTSIASLLQAVTVWESPDCSATYKPGVFDL